MIQQINNKHCCSRLSLNAYFLIVVNLILIVVGCVLVFGHSVNLNREITDPNQDEWSYDDPKWESLIPNWWDQKNFKPPVGPAEESTQEFWKSKAQKTLQDKLNLRINTNKAKNVVIMIGDGMGFSSIMAARSYLKDVSAELSFEKFHHSGMSKVYCVNYQVPDSACTATAILRGVKNNYSVIGLTSKVNLYNCSASHDEEARIPSIFKYAQDADKSTGIVTTTRVTHSTPAAVYAYAASRNWESDDNLVPDGCDDIGKQLIHGPVGRKLDVVLGGGLGNLMPEDLGGKRRDGRNLIDEYKKQHKNSSVVYNKDQLKSVDPKTTDKLLGLFANSHLDFKILANDEIQPTLTEMTAKALDILKKNQENGFMLMVEGGRIDRAHHENQAHLALAEVVEFHKAVEYVKQNTNEEDTLIIVTADHSHPFTIGGYLLDPHGVVDYLNIMLMITVFAFVVNLVEIGYVIRQLYRNRTIIFPWDVLIIPPIVFIIQFYFTIIIESLYRKCEDKGEDDRERVSIVPVEIRGYENQVMKRQIEANGRVLLETDV